LDGKSEVIVFDDSLPGFGLRVRRSGARTWVYQFKIGSQHRRITLGNANALAATEARKSATELHAKVRLGRDPAGEKAEGQARAGETMAAALPPYLARQRDRLRPSSYSEIERHLLNYAKPLHGLQLARINRRAIAARLGTVASTRGKIAANRTRTSLSAFFAWCMREGLTDNNPVIGTNRQEEKSRDRVLADEELRTIWAALDSTDYAAIVRLLTLTGQRANEIAGLRWSEIVGDRVILPATRTKNRREHIIPIVPAVQTILDGRQHRDIEFVFGRRRGKPFRGWGVCKGTLDQHISARGGELAHWTHHDLRRTMSTRMHDELGIAPHIVEAILNHVSGHRAGVAGVYNRSLYLKEKAAALARWADYVMAAVSGERSNIVPMAARSAS
jgi:integrase